MYWYMKYIPCRHGEFYKIYIIVYNQFTIFIKYLFYDRQIIGLRITIEHKIHYDVLLSKIILFGFFSIDKAGFLRIIIFLYLLNF